MIADIRWGVVGPGRIAEKVVEDFPVVDGARAHNRSDHPELYDKVSRDDLLGWIEEI